MMVQAQGWRTERARRGMSVIRCWMDSRMSDAHSVSRLEARRIKKAPADRHGANGVVGLDRSQWVVRKHNEIAPLAGCNGTELTTQAEGLRIVQRRRLQHLPEAHACRGEPLHLEIAVQARKVDRGRRGGGVGAEEEASVLG